MPSIRGFSKRSDAIILYVQRGSRHFPYPPQCALLAEDKVCVKKNICDIYIYVYMLYICIYSVIKYFLNILENRRRNYIYI